MKCALKLDDKQCSLIYSRFQSSAYKKILNPAKFIRDISQNIRLRLHIFETY